VNFPLTLTFLLVAAYLLGSIPFGIFMTKLFGGSDIRRAGSGNIGATNVSRTSPTLGFVTLLLDGLKGAGAVLLAAHLFPGNTKLEAIAALFAILGHVFPWWLKFRGGKGVATGTGAFLVLVPKAALVAMAVFAAIFLLFRYVSLASMAMFVALPLAAWFFGLVPSVLIIVVVASALVVAKHHENILRLLNGCESRWGSR